MKTKGQAAMEFLMTYGWAILAAIIVIGVLAIYFRPGNLVSETAMLSAPFTVVSQVVGTTEFDVEFRNGGGETYTAMTVAFTFNSPNTVTCTPVLAAAQGGAAITSMTSGQTAFIRCTYSAAQTAGTTIDGDLTITYTRPGATIPLTTTGTVTGKA